VKAKSIRQIRIRYPDLNAEREDPFMRYWIILSDRGQLRIGPHNEGRLAKIFVDTGADCNTISRKFYFTLLDQGLKCALILGPSEGLSINLVGGQTLHVTGDRVLIQTEVGINLGNFHSDQDFLILDQDSEDLVMGVQWYNLILKNPIMFPLKLWISVQEGS